MIERIDVPFIKAIVCEAVSKLILQPKSEDNQDVL